MKVLAYCLTKRRKWFPILGYFNAKPCPLASAFTEFLTEERDYETQMRPSYTVQVRESCDAAIVSGWRRRGSVLITKQLHDELRSKGIPFLTISDGFVRRKKDWVTSQPDSPDFHSKGNVPDAYSAVARDGLHAYGKQVPLDFAGPERWERLGIEMTPWRKSGEHIVVAHQHVPYGPDGVNRPAWYWQILGKILSNTKRPIVFRAHPRLYVKKKSNLERLWDELVNRFNNDPRIRLSTGSLADDLEGAHVLVTYDSNAALDAVLNGVPICVQGKTMADPVAGRGMANIIDPVTPDREQWAYWLAYTQWTRSEMRSGEPWHYLMESNLIE